VRASVRASEERKEGVRQEDALAGTRACERAHASSGVGMNRVGQVNVGVREVEREDLSSAKC
jgi:hypothetical protein